MKLEDLPKYYSPKSPGLTDASASTSKDALSITDVMAAQGMTQNRAEMGFSAFLGKMGISMNDRERATELCTQSVRSCGGVEKTSGRNKTGSDAHYGFVRF